MEGSQLIGYSHGVFNIVVLEEGTENFLSLFLYLASVTTQDGLDLSLSLGSGNETNPRTLYVLRLRGENLHLVATLQFMTQWHELMVHLGSDTVRAQEGVDAEGKVECRTARRHGLDFALGGEHKDFRGKEVELDGVEEVHGVGLWVVKDFLDGAQPVVQFVFVLGELLLHAVLVFPVGSKALFGYFVHAVGTYLHLNPSSLFRHEGDVERLIAVGFRMREPVAQAVGVRLIDFRDGHIDVEAFVDFLFALVGGEDDAHSQNIVNLVEGDVLVLHLVPDGVGRLYALLNLIFHTHLAQRLLDGRCKLVEELMALGLGRGKLGLDAVIFVGMLVLETQVLEFRLNLVKTQAVGEGRIDIQRLTGNLILFVGRLRLQGAHIVQTVAYLDEDDADVFAHGEQQFLEVLCLGRGLFTEDAAANLGQTVHNLGYLRTEDVLNVLGGIVGIFHHVV